VRFLARWLHALLHVSDGFKALDFAEIICADVPEPWTCYACRDFIQVFTTCWVVQLPPSSWHQNQAICWLAGGVCWRAPCLHRPYSWRSQQPSQGNLLLFSETGVGQPSFTLAATIRCNSWYWQPATASTRSPEVTRAAWAVTFGTSRWPDQHQLQLVLQPSVQTGSQQQR